MPSLLSPRACVAFFRPPIFFRTRKCGLAALKFIGCVITARILLDLAGTTTDRIAGDCLRLAFLAAAAGACWFMWSVVITAQGFRPVTEAEYQRLIRQDWWHRSRDTWTLGTDIELIPQTGFRAHMFRSDRVLRRGARAVYFTTDLQNEEAAQTNGVSDVPTVLRANLHSPPQREQVFVRVQSSDVAVTVPVPCTVTWVSAGDA